MECYHDLHEALQSRYEAPEIKKTKPEESRTRDKDNKTSNVTRSSPASFSFSKVISSVEVRPDIKLLCDKADGHGLRNYIMDNVKEVATLRNELPVALSKASDAAKLVLKAMEGYDLSESVSMEFLVSANRTACIVLLESLFPVFGNNDNGVVPSDVKDSARDIAKVWRKEMEFKNNEDSANGMNIKAFLQLLATFRIAADYEKDVLLGLLSAILHRNEAPELCRSLGLSSQAPTLMNMLSKRQEQIRILRFAHVCGMMDKVDPVLLLRSYLGNAMEGAEELLRKRHGGLFAAKHDSNVKKVSAMRCVIKHVKEYGLQSHFSGDNLEEKLRELVQEKEDLKKNKKKDAEKEAQEKEDGKKAAEKEAQEKEDGKKDAEKKAQQKRHQSFEPGYGPLERENYASKRPKYASLKETTRVIGGMGNSKAPPSNIDGFQNKSGIIGPDHHTSTFSAANRSSTVLASGLFTSAPSIAAEINDERRRNPSAFGTSNQIPIGSSLYGSSVPAGAFGTSNLTPIGSSLYGSSVLAGAFAVPLSNVAEVNYEGRGQQSYPMNFGEVDKNHVRTSVYGTGDLAKSSATQSNYNYEGRGWQGYKLNFGEVDNNLVSALAYGTRISENSSATRGHYEKRGRELYTSAFGGGNMSSIGSSVYGSNSRIIPSSDVNQGGHERSLGQYSGFAGRNIVSIESSGYGPKVSTVLPSSNVTQGHFESGGSVIDRYWLNSGLTSLPYRAS